MRYNSESVQVKFVISGIRVVYEDKNYFGAFHFRSDKPG